MNTPFVPLLRAWLAAAILDPRSARGLTPLPHGGKIMNDLARLAMGAPMNKSELIENVAQRMNLPKKKAEDVVNLIFDGMTNTLVRGNRIEIRGLGSFTVKNYGSYVGRNPRTGESIQVRPKRLPFFKVGKELRERVDQQKGGPSTGSLRYPSNGGQSNGS